VKGHDEERTSTGDMTDLATLRRGRKSFEQRAWSDSHRLLTDPRGRTAVYSVVDQGYLQHSRARDLETGQETTLPFALYGHRFSRDGHWIAGESREGELVV
jgi:hypothetical protein